MNITNNCNFTGRIQVRTDAASTSNEPIIEKETHEYDEVALKMIKKILDDPNNNKTDRLSRSIRMSDGIYLYSQENGLEIKDYINNYYTVYLTLTTSNVKKDLQETLKSLINRFNDRVDKTDEDKKDTSTMTQRAIGFMDSFIKKLK
ncbi:MAG: hypothetical protein AB1782_07035 [Cyanobacteriota bacterium]